LVRREAGAVEIEKRNGSRKSDGAESRQERREAESGAEEKRGGKYSREVVQQESREAYQRESSVKQK